MAWFSPKEYQIVRWSWNSWTVRFGDWSITSAGAMDPSRGRYPPGSYPYPGNPQNAPAQGPGTVPPLGPPMTGPPVVAGPNPGIPLHPNPAPGGGGSNPNYSGGNTFQPNPGMIGATVAEAALQARSLRQACLLSSMALAAEAESAFRLLQLLDRYQEFLRPSAAAPVIRLPPHRLSRRGQKGRKGATYQIGGRGF